LLNIHDFTYTFSYAHTEAHTLKHTCIIGTQKEWRQPDTEAWLRGAEEKLLLETKALHTHKKRNDRKKWLEKTDIHESNEKCLSTVVFDHYRPQVLLVQWAQRGTVHP